MFHVLDTVQGLIPGLFENVNATITAVGTAMKNAADAAFGLVYNSTTGITDVGKILAIGFGVTLVMGCWALVQRLLPR